MPDPPVIRAVGDAALLVEFGATVHPGTHARVVALDAALTADPLPGILETVPAYGSLLVMFDPLLIDPAKVERHLQRGASAPAAEQALAEHVVRVCYDGPHAPDLPDVAARLGLSPDDVAGAHLSGSYRVYMYGFAPGYAYLGGVPAGLRLPRKPAPVRGYPVGSVMIAGDQCLITTLPMPTGWWVIGRTAFRVLEPEGAQPFRFRPGDQVRFERISPAELDAELAA